MESVEQSDQNDMSWVGYCSDDYTVTSKFDYMLRSGSIMHFWPYLELFHL